MLYHIIYAYITKDTRYKQWFSIENLFSIYNARETTLYNII